MARVVSEKQKANLVQYSGLSPTETREKLRKAGIRSGEVRREKRQQRELLFELLGQKIDQLPITKEKKKAMCEAVGVDKKTLVATTHVLALTERAIIEGDRAASDKLWEADGSHQPQAIDISMGGVTINLTASKEAKEAKEIWEGDIEDLDE